VHLLAQQLIHPGAIAGLLYSNKFPTCHSCWPPTPFSRISPSTRESHSAYSTGRKGIGQHTSKILSVPVFSLLNMFDRQDHTTYERADFPPYIPHEDIEELKELDGSEEEILFQDGRPVVARSPGTTKTTRWAVGCLLAFVPGFLRSRLGVGLLQLLVPSFLRSGSAEPKKLHSTAWLGM
jgi:hypothetical protein